MRFRLPLLVICLLASTVFAQNGGTAKSPYEEAFSRLEYRSIGPAIMGGRIADVEGVPGDANVVYVASASGGLWKTTNGGVTWKPIFERQGTISLGDIALAPSNPEVIWVGTGESNVRNSVSFGDGVYKSTDGGKTWQHMGLKDTERISAIAIHPQNPDIVYVGALGHAFGPNEERGVFMTTDGGKTWTKTLYIDNQHGVADLEIDPTNPNILYAGMWSFERKPWTHRSGSEKGGVYKSIDGGRTWNKLTNGLPKLMGRIGIRVAPSNPNVVYAIVEAKDGTLYRSDDRGETFKHGVEEHRHRLARFLLHDACASIRQTRTTSLQSLRRCSLQSTAARHFVRSRAAHTSTSTRSGSIRRTQNECGTDRTVASASLTMAASRGKLFTTFRSASSTRFMRTIGFPSTT